MRTWLIFSKPRNKGRNDECSSTSLLFDYWQRLLSFSCNIRPSLKINLSGSVALGWEQVLERALLGSGSLRARKYSKYSDVPLHSSPLIGKKCRIFFENVLPFGRGAVIFTPTHHNISAEQPSLPLVSSCVIYCPAPLWLTLPLPRPLIGQSRPLLASDWSSLALAPSPEDGGGRLSLWGD